MPHGQTQQQLFFETNKINIPPFPSASCLFCFLSEWVSWVRKQNKKSVVSQASRLYSANRLFPSSSSPNSSSWGSFIKNVSPGFEKKKNQLSGKNHRSTQATDHLPVPHLQTHLHGDLCGVLQSLGAPSGDPEGHCRTHLEWHKNWVIGRNSSVEVTFQCNAKDYRMHLAWGQMKNRNGLLRSTSM